MTTPPEPRAALPTDRLRGLLAADRAILNDLALEPMLGRIVGEARALVGARSAALGVVGPERTVERFVQHASEPTPVPTALSLLLAVIDHPATTLRLPDLRAELRARAFADEAPAFLGIQIRVHAEVIAALYVTGSPAGTFTATDEELLAAFAAMAGTAIENARLYEDARRTHEWLTASGAIARQLLAGAGAELLVDVVTTAVRVAGADYGGLMLPTGDGLLRVAATAGIAADEFDGVVFDPQRSAMGRAIIAGRSLALTDMTRMATPGFDNVHNFGPAIMAPLVDANGVRGAVLLMRTADRLPFTSRDLDQATTFATQVALALEFNDARAHAEELRALEVRHSIAQNLHDNVMQRLFATGVGLQQLAESPLPPEVAARLQQSVDDLDETIDAIRTQVFGLREDEADPPATGSAETSQRLP